VELKKRKRKVICKDCYGSGLMVLAGVHRHCDTCQGTGYILKVYFRGDDER
jgi:DnaJ-class molecular chaperone